jgi:para-nitrobenzyl esterase
MAFTSLGLVVMQAQQRIGQPCWRYWFDYVAEAEHDTYANGAWHGNEVPYVFDNLMLTEPACHYVNERDLAFAAKVADYWVTLPAKPASPAMCCMGLFAGRLAAKGATDCYAWD